MPIGPSRSKPSLGRPSPSKGAVVDHRRLTSTFDLHAELTRNRADYGGDAWVTISSLSPVVATCIERVRADIKPKPGTHPTISACLTHGLEYLERSQAVQDLISAKRDLDTATNVDIDDLEEVLQWYRSHPITIDSNFTQRRMTIQVPDHLRSTLSELSTDVGIKQAVIANIAAMLTLVSQPSILTSHRRSMQATIDAFDRRIARRSVMLKALLECIQRMHRT